jgi:hypothetical protein
VTRPADFDSRERNSQRLTYVLALAFYVGAYALCRLAYGPVLGFVVSSPILGVYVSLLILHRGGGTLRWAKWWTLRKSDGQYHAFQDLPVQVLWRDGQCWVRARDVFRVIAEEPDQHALRRLALRFGEAQFFADHQGEWWFGEAAVVQWLDARGQKLDTVAMKFQLWLQREVFPPMHRRSERG